MDGPERINKPDGIHPAEIIRICYFFSDGIYVACHRSNTDRLNSLTATE